MRRKQEISSWVCQVEVGRLQAELRLDVMRVGSHWKFWGRAVTDGVGWLATACRKDVLGYIWHSETLHRP